MIIVNADDWGRSREETDAARDCISRGRVTSASAMVFMEDSERAATIAKDARVDVGLHLNLSEHFSGLVRSKALSEYHNRIVRFLRFSKYALILYHPALRNAFRHVYNAQFDEFVRLYGKPPSHVDGHQHMHLCSNMLLAPIITDGTKVRRSFSFWPGEKSLLNRSYRRWVDRRLARRYRLTEYFFALSQTLEWETLLRVSRLAHKANVELETHPVMLKEKALLLSENFQEAMVGIQRGSYALI